MGKTFQVTQQHPSVAIAQVHAVALTVAPVAAVGTVVLLHPLAIAIRMVAVFPDVHEVILVDIPLMVVGADAGTGADCAVGHHRAYGDACLT